MYRHAKIYNIKNIYGDTEHVVIPMEFQNFPPTKILKHENVLDEL